MKRFLLVLTVCALMCCLLIFSASAVDVEDSGDTKFSAVGDCVIKGLDGVTIPSPTRGLKYSIDEINEFATVTGRGSFQAGTDFVVPSSVTYNGKVYPVTGVGSALLSGVATSSVFIPDSVTVLEYQSFSNSTRGAIYIGSGLDEISGEVFSNAQGITEFVCKSKPKVIRRYAFNMTNSSTSTPATRYELDLSEVTEIVDYGFYQSKLITYANLSDKLTSIGSQAFCQAERLAGTVIIPQGCSLGFSAFNGCHALSTVVIEIADGEIKDIPAQLFSNAGTNDFSIVFTGRVNVTSEEPLTGKRGVNQKVYFTTLDYAQEFVNDIVANNTRKERLTYVTYYICDEGKTYSCDTSGVLTEKQGDYLHCYTELLNIDADCSNFQREAYVCYCCGYENKVSQGSEYGPHKLTYVEKLPTCTSKGYKEFTCMVCAIEFVGEWKDAISHTIEEAGYSVNGHIITVTGACINCGGAQVSEQISLVNKTYIEGYGLFDATLSHITVSADGVVTPNSSATFNKTVIYFPSYVQQGDTIIEVKKIQGFKGKSIQQIYVPDTVDELVCPSNSSNGCFGDNSALTTVVVGKGVTKIGRELFSMGGGATITTFIFKGTITELGQYSLQNMNKGEGLVYELNTRLETIGTLVNTGNLLQEVYIAYGCEIAGKAFNGALGIVNCYVEGGETASEATALPVELFSGNNRSLRVYMNGYVVTGGNHVSPTYGAHWYFGTRDQMIEFIRSASGRQGNERFGQSAFFTCSDVGSETDGNRWRIQQGNISSTTTIDKFYHDNYGVNEHISLGGVVVEPTCSAEGSVTANCFVCSATLATETIEKLPHSYDGGVITVMPNCKELGVIVYNCLACDDTEEVKIFRDLETHDFQFVLLYANGGYCLLGM